MGDILVAHFDNRLHGLCGVGGMRGVYGGASARIQQSGDIKSVFCFKQYFVA